MTEREVTLLRDFITWQSLPFVDNVFSTRDETIKHFNEWLILVSGEQQPSEDKGEISDGYHTFNQLYHQRAVLFACIVKQNKNKAWKSFKHSDGKYCFDSDGEWFIVGVDTPQGSYTYHYSKEYWDMFDCQELECGKEWDGHTEEDVTRLLSLEQQPCIEDYPTCTECEHYDREKHYCPRFCQVIKDTLAEAQPCEDCRNCKKWNKCPCGKEGHENGTSIGYSIGECKDYEPSEDCINCISRESIKQKLQEHRDFYVNAYGGFSNLSQNDKSRVDEIDNCIAMVVNEPSVTLQRLKGKWIETPVENDVVTVVFKCSECGMRVVNPYKYCPNCGVKMGVDNE